MTRIYTHESTPDQTDLYSKASKVGGRWLMKFDPTVKVGRYLLHTRKQGVKTKVVARVIMHDHAKFMEAASPSMVMSLLEEIVALRLELAKEKAENHRLLGREFDGRFAVVPPTLQHKVMREALGLPPIINDTHPENPKTMARPTLIERERGYRVDPRTHDLD